MVEYDLNKGLYPYPLKYLPSDGGTVSESFVAGDPTVEPAADNWYVFCLTPGELQAFRNIINVGAPIVYQDDYQTWWQKWAQFEQFPNVIPEDSCLDICLEVLNCINTNEDIQRAIGKYALTSAITDETGEDQTILDTDLFGEQAPCDKDAIFGMCRQLTDFLNETSENILEIFVTAFATPARIGDIIEAIPVVGELPFDDILQLTEKMSETINDAYQAAYDTQINEDIACLFFCAAQDDCELTMELARDLIKANISNPTSGQDFVTMINDIIANNYIGEQSIWLMHYFILETIIFGSEILGQDINRFVVTIATFFNDPDSDWSILCTDCCNEVTETFDFTTDAFSSIWTPRPHPTNPTQYIPGTGYQNEQPQGAQIYTERYESITSLTAVFVVTAGNGSMDLRQYNVSTNDGSQVIGSEPWTGNVSIADALLLNVDSDAGTWVSIIEEVTITGCLAS